MDEAMADLRAREPAARKARSGAPALESIYPAALYEQLRAEAVFCGEFEPAESQPSGIRLRLPARAAVRQQDLFLPRDDAADPRGARPLRDLPFHAADPEENRSPTRNARNPLARGGFAPGGRLKRRDRASAWATSIEASATRGRRSSSTPKRTSSPRSGSSPPGPRPGRPSPSSRTSRPATTSSTPITAWAFSGAWSRWTWKAGRPNSWSSATGTTTPCSFPVEDLNLVQKYTPVGTGASPPG